MNSLDFMKSVKLVITVEVPFHDYGSNTKNKKVKGGVRRWIREVLRNEATYIPLYIERDEHGNIIEDTSGKAKYKVK